MQKQKFSLVRHGNVILVTFVIEELQLANRINQELHNPIKKNVFSFVPHVKGSIDMINQILRDYSMAICYGEPKVMKDDRFPLLLEYSFDVRNSTLIFYRKDDSDTNFLCRVRGNYKLTKELQEIWPKRTKPKDMQKTADMLAEMIDCHIISIDNIKNPAKTLSDAVQWNYAINPEITYENTLMDGTMRVKATIVLPTGRSHTGIGITRNIAKRFAAIEALKYESFDINRKKVP